MYKVITGITAAALLLAGCASKEHAALMKSYEQEKSYHKRLMKTEKAQLYENNRTKVTLTATYLNRNSRAKEGEEDTFLNYVNPFEIFEDKAKREPKEDEKFIVGIYVDDDADSMGIKDFNLTLNASAPQKILSIPHNDPRLKEISFVSDWSQFYYVVFPHINAEGLHLVLKTKRYGKATLYFTKKAKYVYTHKAF